MTPESEGHDPLSRYTRQVSATLNGRAVDTLLWVAELAFRQKNEPQTQ